MKKLDGFTRGIDLGGWLSQCDHTTERYENFITEDDIKTVSSWGADHVRVPVDYELIEDENGDYKENGFSYIEKAITWCKKFGLNMVLDLHKTYGYSFDKYHNESGFFENTSYQERFYKLWEEFAKRFSENEDMLIFELLNEVTDQSYSDSWNRISTECIKRIRKISPSVRILLGGYWNNSADAIKDLVSPLDENVIYNFHCYDPLIFTHQGAHWIADILPSDIRIPINMPLGQIKEVIDTKAPDLAEGFRMPGGPDAKIDKDYFIERFREPVSIAKERGTELYCGEYGVIDHVPSKDILEWYKAINGAFEYYGIGRATWSYKQMDFGLSDARLDDVREELLKYI